MKLASKIQNFQLSEWISVWMLSKNEQICVINVSNRKDNECEYDLN